MDLIIPLTKIKKTPYTAQTAEEKLSLSMRIPTEPFREEQFVRTVNIVSMLILLSRNQRVQMIEKSELLRLIEVGASCFNHYCVGYDDT